MKEVSKSLIQTSGRMGAARRGEEASVSAFSASCLWTKLHEKLGEVLFSS